MGSKLKFTTLCLRIRTTSEQFGSNSWQRTSKNINSYYFHTIKPHAHQIFTKAQSHGQNSGWCCRLTIYWIIWFGSMDFPDHLKSRKKADWVKLPGSQNESSGRAPGMCCSFLFNPWGVIVQQATRSFYKAQFERSKLFHPDIHQTQMISTALYSSFVKSN